MPKHSLTEWEQFLNDILVFIVGIALLWFGLWRMQIIKDRAAEEDHKQDVADQLERRKAEVIELAKSGNIKPLSEKDKIKKFVHGSTIDIKV